MIKAVLDTTTIVSGTISGSGTSYQVLEAARSRRFTLVTSAPLITEVVRALSRDRVRRRYSLSAEDVDRVRQLLEQETTPTPITHQVAGVATHPEDDLIGVTSRNGK